MDWKHNKAAEMLGISYPIFQAPMAGVTTPELVSEASNSGGLGNIGAGYMEAADIRETVNKIRRLTDKPFGINLFVPDSRSSFGKEDFSRIQDVVNGVAGELGLSSGSEPVQKDYQKLYEMQLEEVFQSNIPVCSFTFGIPEDTVIKELKKQGSIVIGTATNVNEALELEKAGMDLIVAQGSEAGGHRGTFHEEGTGFIGSMALIPQMADAVNVPVIAAGGIMDGRGIAAAMILGAQGVQLGTAFLTCEESGANQVWKEALLSHSEDQTVFTKAFSGRFARGISNRFIKEMESYETILLPFPNQNDVTGPMRKQAAKSKNGEYMSLWSGQGIRLAEMTKVKDLMEKLVRDTDHILSKS